MQDDSGVVVEYEVVTQDGANFFDDKVFVDR